MKNHNRLYNLLAAASLTTVLVLTFLLFSGNPFGAATSATATPLTGTTMPSSGNVDSANTPALAGEQLRAAAQASAAQAPELTTLRAQNTQLRQMLQVMQARELQYQSQLDAANQALQTFQAQANTQRDESYTEANEHEAHSEQAELGDRDHDD